jgi:hypothetical protein
VVSLSSLFVFLASSAISSMDSSPSSARMGHLPFVDAVIVRGLPGLGDVESPVAFDLVRDTI